LPLVAPKSWYLDLDNGRIRALAYDPELEGYLIVSRREDKKGKPFKLWFWSGDPAVAPQRVSIASVENINRAGAALASAAAASKSLPALKTRRRYWRTSAR